MLIKTLWGGLSREPGAYFVLLRLLFNIKADEFGTLALNLESLLQKTCIITFFSSSQCMLSLWQVFQEARKQEECGNPWEAGEDATFPVQERKGRPPRPASHGDCWRTRRAGVKTWSGCSRSWVLWLYGGACGWQLGHEPQGKETPPPAETTEQPGYCRRGTEATFSAPALGRRKAIFGFLSHVLCSSCSPRSPSSEIPYPN